VPRLVNEDSPHGLRRGGEEMTATLPMGGHFHTDYANVRFVNQGRGLQRGRLFLGHLMRRQFAQLFIDEWKKLVGRLRIPFQWHLRFV
jgi:hypothetical protein